MVHHTIHDDTLPLARLVSRFGFVRRGRRRSADQQRGGDDVQSRNTTAQKPYRRGKVFHRLLDE